MNTRKDAYLALLEKWAAFADADLHRRSETESFYGTGYNTWGVQTNQKYLSAMAVLATTQSEAIDSATKQRARENALAALRFSLGSHLANNGVCTDGTQWGNTWISALGVERMMHGVIRLREFLTDDDHALLRNMLVSEADWLLEHYHKNGKPALGGTLWNWDGNNIPESNIWNGAIVWRAATMYPEHPRAAVWEERAHMFLANGMSTPADALDDTVIAGKPLRARHLGPNFFPNYALDHHGYLNIGYIIISLSNIAMLHFDQKALALPLPETLYLHAADVWRVAKRMIFSDGRLARIGGDTRLRYTYCQEYLMPVLAFAADFLGDADALYLLDRQLELIQHEADCNADGSFFSQRLEHLRRTTTYYYTRLESDRACALGMTLNALEMLDADTAETLPRAPESQARFEAAVAGHWHEPDHGDVMHRAPSRLASFAWNGAFGPMGLCTPPDDGHIAEWVHNLAGHVRFMGSGDKPGDNRRQARDISFTLFDGGFCTIGALDEGADLNVPEGWSRKDPVATTRIAFAALPDAHTAVGLQLSESADIDTFVLEAAAMHLSVPNDVYNAGARTLRHEHGATTLRSGPGKDTVTPLDSAWANVDDKLGAAVIYGADTLSLKRCVIRQGGYIPSLHTETLVAEYHADMAHFAPGSRILDCGWITLANADAATTQNAYKAARVGGSVTLESPSEYLRAVIVRGQDARDYLVAANFGDSATTLRTNEPFVILGADSATPPVNEHTLPATGMIVARVS